MTKIWVEDHGCYVPKTIHLPCGNEAYFCHEAGYGYRCGACFAVAGSVGQPRVCKEATEKYVMLKALGSKARWDYELGEEVIDK